MMDLACADAFDDEVPGPEEEKFSPKEGRGGDLGRCGCGFFSVAAVSSVVGDGMSKIATAPTMAAVIRAIARMVMFSFIVAPRKG
jgi:hypothetical protein